MNSRRCQPIKHLPRAGRRVRGVAAVELGFTIVPLLILTFGVTEYGRAIFTYNALDKATRDAARHMTSPSVDRRAEAINLAVYGSLAPTATPLAPGLVPADVVVCDAADSSGCPGEQHANVPIPGGGVADLVTVRISGYTYTSIVTYVAPATLNFNNISTTMRSE